MQSLRCAAIVLAAACSDRPSPDRAPASGSAPAPAGASDAAPVGSASPDSVAAAPPSPDAPPRDDKAIRAKHALRVDDKGDRAELSDASGHIRLVLPAAPVVDGRIIDQDNVHGFHAQAVMNGKAPIDAEVGLISILDGDLPASLIQQMAQVPEQLATATGGKVVVNEASTLAGKTARRFELVTPDKRRLFGWYASVGVTRILTINCIGADLEGIRKACEAIPKSLVLGKDPGPGTLPP
jgi:hypothetical protein